MLVEELKLKLGNIRESMIERKGQEGILLVDRETYKKVYDALMALPPKSSFSTFDTDFEIETYKRGKITCKKVVLPDGSYYTKKEIVHGFVAIQNAIQIIKEYST